jgi:hypothetical protein
LFPIFQYAPADPTGITIVNSSSDAREFRLVLTSAEGIEIKTQIALIPPKEERHYSINEIAGAPGTLPAGWVRVESPTADFSAYMTSGTPMSLGAPEPLSHGASNLLLPNIRIHRGFRELGETDTVVALVNPGNDPVVSTLTLMAYDGSVRGTTQVTVPGAGSRLVRLSTAIPPIGINVDLDGYVSIRSSGPVAAWQQIETPLARTTLSAVDPSAFHRQTQLTSPFFAIGGGYESTLTLTNTALTAVTVELSGRDQVGRPIGEITQLTLQPGETRAWDIASALRVATIATYPGPTITGTLRLRQPEKQLMQLLASLTIQVFDSQRAPQSLMQYWVREEPGQFWEIPFATKHESYYTAYAIANTVATPGVTTQVLVTVHSRDGRIINLINHSLEPLGFTAQVVIAAEPVGYMRILSDEPVVVLGAIGTRDGLSAEAIQTQRLPK